jgi:hypothetical protein
LQKNFFRLANARHIREDKGVEGEGERRGGEGRELAPQTQKPNSAYVTNKIDQFLQVNENYALEAPRPKGVLSYYELQVSNKEIADNNICPMSSLQLNKTFPSPVRPISTCR